MNSTISLPTSLLQRLSLLSHKYNVPESKILEDALKAYLSKIEKAEFAKSFRKASKDEEIIHLAEEGLVDYLNILENE